MHAETDFDLSGNETPEELDALLDSMDTLALADEPDDSDVTDNTDATDESSEAVEPHATEDSDVNDGEATDLEPIPPDADTDAAPAAAGEETPAQSENDSPPEGIATRDNQHIIPFEVLEREREEKRALSEELASLRAERKDWEQSQRLLAVRDRQLEKLGVRPEDLPENLDFTDDQLDALTEDYPGIAGVIKHLVAKVKTLDRDEPAPGTVEGTALPETDPVTQAVRDNADLNTWQHEGGAKWDRALAIDDALRADPHWQDRPLAERFAEVSRQVNAAFDTPAEPVATPAEVKAQADAAEKDAEASLPASPSEVGTTAPHEGTVRDRAATASAEEISAMFSNMTDDQIEALLSDM